MDAVVFGNITLDVLCYPVDEVPRYESLTFERVLISPGGCGSNVAIGLSALGVPTGLVGHTGSDEACEMAEKFWRRVNLDTRFVQRYPDYPTGTSVGLIDHNAQPRFIHTPGANQTLTANDLEITAFKSLGARSLHVGGFFVLPGVLDGSLPPRLQQAKNEGLFTTLDVVRSVRMADPTPLWPCLPFVDVFFCNAAEASKLTGQADAARAGEVFLSKGVGAAVIKLGEQGCLLIDRHGTCQVPATPPSQVVDTTGAGDAFAAGFIAAVLRGKSLQEACVEGNYYGARAVETFGAISCWLR